MTNPGIFGRRPQGAPSVPRGEVLGSYDTYPEAQKVVDRLAKAEFPVAKVSIVGNDLKTVERVTGRLSYGRAALAGALSGLWFGLFLGLLFVLVAPDTAVAVLPAALLIGAASGMFFRLITYGAQRRSHDFTSLTQVLASSYDVIVAPELLITAQESLARTPAE